MSSPHTGGHLVRIALLLSACLLLGPWLHAAALSGSVKDPSGALVSGAAVSLARLPRGAPVRTKTRAIMG
jgi:hypothetical protein